jgi:hypothetical protein
LDMSESARWGGDAEATAVAVRYAAAAMERADLPSGDPEEPCVNWIAFPVELLPGPARPGHP